MLHKVFESLTIFKVNIFLRFVVIQQSFITDNQSFIYNSLDAK